MDDTRNFSKATVSLGYDAAATAIVLTAGGGARLATPPFNMPWWNATDYPDPSDDPLVEIVRVTANVADVLTVIRAQEGTVASAKNIAGKTYKMLAGITDDYLRKLLPLAGNDTATPRLQSVFLKAPDGLFYEVFLTLQDGVVVLSQSDVGVP